MSVSHTSGMGRYPSTLHQVSYHTFTPRSVSLTGGIGRYPSTLRQDRCPTTPSPLGQSVSHTGGMGRYPSIQHQVFYHTFTPRPVNHTGGMGRYPSTLHQVSYHTFTPRSVSQVQVQVQNTLLSLQRNLPVVPYKWYGAIPEYPAPGQVSTTPSPLGQSAIQVERGDTRVPCTRPGVLPLLHPYRLVGLVVKAPPGERKIPGSNLECAEIFPGPSHVSDLKTGIPVATLSGAWRCKVSAGTGGPGVSIL